MREEGDFTIPPSLVGIGPSRGLLKNLDAGGFAVIPVSEPTDAGGFDGIHFMIFTFVFAFDPGSREGAPRPNPERMRRIYTAASVSSPVGSDTGMTAVVCSERVGTFSTAP